MKVVGEFQNRRPRVNPLFCFFMSLALLAFATIGDFVKPGEGLPLSWAGGILVLLLTVYSPVLLRSNRWKNWK